MNIQMYAEGTGEAGGSGSADGQGEDGLVEGVKEEGSSEKPSYEELLEKLAQSETKATQAAAEAEKWKAANDKSSSEAANYKKQLTAKMTAQEQFDAAKKEAEEAKDKKFAEMEEKLATIEATKRYMVLEMGEKMAEETAKAEISGDMDTVVSNIAKHIKAIKDTAYQQALKDRPDVKGGNGDADTKSPALLKAMELSGGKTSRTVNVDDLKAFM